MSRRNAVPEPTTQRKFLQFTFFFLCITLLTFNILGMRSASPETTSAQISGPFSAYPPNSANIIGRMPTRHELQGVLRSNRNSTLKQSKEKSEKTEERKLQL